MNCNLSGSLRSDTDDHEVRRSNEHDSKKTEQLDQLLAAIAATAEEIHERNEQKSINKFMLANKDNMKTHHGTVMANFHRKRSKPRRQSGLPVARMTEDTFKHTRPLLIRDDSVYLLKEQTINAIPVIVPLAPADDEVKTRTNDCPTLDGPLSRIQRRRKPRRMSGAAVAAETRPILFRDDSLVLAKHKLPGTLSHTSRDEKSTVGESSTSPDTELEVFH